jgi:parallel beta-helix repeat protein
MEYDYVMYSGWPAVTPFPDWLKVEFLSVEETNATVRVTLHMSNGTEQNATVPIDIVAGGEALGLSGFVVPANLTTGDVVHMSGYGDVTITDETTLSCAGVNRTVVYTIFSQYGTSLTYIWDKQTGIMVQASTVTSTTYGIARASDTNIWQALAETIYIRADGNTAPPTAPISTADNVTYALTANVTSDADGIVVKRDNIVINGAGYKVQGITANSINGVILTGRSNVTIKNTTIENFAVGINMHGGSSNNNICGNTITNNELYGIVFAQPSNHNSVSGNSIINDSVGILLGRSSNYNSLSGNNITNNFLAGIMLESSNSNSISRNYVTNNCYGIWFYPFQASAHNSIGGNYFASNSVGLDIGSAENCSICGNTITDSEYGIRQNGPSSPGPSGAKVYHNNFINAQTDQAYDIWDYGYPSGGNYWSDYNGTDLYRGTHQNETGSDGIGDTPFNLDRYPLMDHWYQILGDIDFDGKVSLADLVLLANVYGSKLGDAKWNFNADMSDNGKVDLSDLVMLALHYGQHNP